MIDIRNVTKRYGDLVAVNDLSFNVSKGKIFGFLGPNGAGKSTTIKMMVGLTRPDSGSIHIGNFDVQKDPIKAKKILAYVPEKGYIFDKMTGHEFLTFISGLYELDNDTFTINSRKYLEVFNIAEWGDEVIGNYSHGMKQRLLLTSSLMRNPEVLILDEPHNGLDPRGVKILRDVIFGLRDNGMTIVLCTHIIAIAEQMCDSIAIMNKGKIVADGNREDLLGFARSGDKTLEDIFLRLTSDYDTDKGKS